MTDLTAMPSKFDAGTTVTFRRALDAYPASLWTMKGTLAGKDVLTVTADEDGDDFVVTFTAAETSALAGGLYQYSERVENVTSEKYATDGPRWVDVRPDLQTAAPGDATSAIDTMIEKLEASLIAGAGSDVMTYQIEGRMLQRYTLKERVDLLSRLKKLRAQLVSGDTVFSRPVRLSQGDKTVRP